MSDASKAHKLKLANSRKRFKELQELKKKNAAKPLLDTTNNEVTEQTTESLTSSVNVETPLENSNIINTQLPTYFTTADYEDGSIFFDNLQKNDIFFNNSQSNNIDCIVPSLSTGDNSKLEFPSIVDQNHSLINQEQIGHNADSQVSEDSDIRSNELFEHQRNLENNLFSEKNKQNLIDYIQGEQQVSHTETTTNLSEIHNSNLSNADSYYVNKVACLIPHEYNDSNSITDLEKRNIELTSYLEQEKNNSIHYKTRINELETQIFQLENQNQLKDKHLSEINKLKEDLNCHSQTIRLLVAEKAELSNGLSQLEINLKTKNSECSELQARLKASRSRAFEFEQELNGLKLEKIHKETNNHDQDKIIENLRRDFDNLQDKNEELKQDLLEVTEKLKSSTEENTNLLKSNSELYSKLSLADIKIQQLTNASHQPTGVQVDQLAQEKIKLEKEVETVNNILKSITKERDESTVHYQKYTEELNYQLATLQEQYQQLQQENDTLSIQEQNRVKHISDLERQLQSIQNERVTFSANLTDCNLKSEFEVTKELCVQLQMEKTELDENYTKTLNEKDMLLKELVAKNDSLSQLESLVEQLRGNQPDSVKLLATMESDKVAAARAVQQNRELKEQLESMTEVFTKMDNDKVELTDRLTVEQSSNRDLLDKLQKTELQLQRLTDAIEIKDRELSHLRETSLELNKQIMQQEQLTDRLRHYEAHNNSSHFLQNELQEAKQTIVRLSNELNNQRNQGTNSELQGSETITLTEDVIHLRKQLEELKLRNQELKTKLNNHSSDNINTENLSEFDDSDNLLKKEEAMKHLEEKVKRTMQDIADLTEEKQRLEHLVLQLQGETETIGEYVALYQHQRMILKQKAVEKDEQLKQLASDREQIKTKLEKLNKLVEKIFQEKVLINSEVVNQYENIHVRHKTLENVEELNDTKSDMQAKEILALLSEIKSSNLVEPKESVHHCPFCSGQLITV